MHVINSWSDWLDKHWSLSRADARMWILIFMLATPRQARLINPQLSFYRASRLPVYATSQVYTGYPDSSLDTDLNNVAFCDMPWILDSNGAHAVPAIQHKGLLA